MSPVGAALDGAGRDAQPLGDLRVGHPRAVGELDDLPLAVGEVLDRLTDLEGLPRAFEPDGCLLYTSDAADDLVSV